MSERVPPSADVRLPIQDRPSFATEAVSHDAFVPGQHLADRALQLGLAEGEGIEEDLGGIILQRPDRRGIDGEEDLIRLQIELALDHETEAVQVDGTAKDADDRSHAV